MKSAKRVLLLGSGWTKPNWAWFPFAAYAKSLGYDSTRIFYPYRGFAPIQYSAKHAIEQIEEILPQYERATYIGHSMGGLVGRYLIQRVGMRGPIDSYVSIGTPHEGTYAANLAPWSKSAHQMRVGSDFLRRLNNLAWPEEIKALTIRGSLEQVVLPPRNAKFTPAKDVVVPNADHLSAVIHPQTFREIGRWLLGLDRQLDAPDYPSDQAV